MRRITTFRATTDRIYDDGPIILYYIVLYYIILYYIILYYIILYYIILYYIILIVVLQLPTVFSTVPYCTGL